MKKLSVCRGLLRACREGLRLCFEKTLLSESDLVSTESEIFSIIMRKFSTSKVWISFCFYELSTIYPTFAGIGGVPRFVYGPFRGGPGTFIT